MADNQAEAEPVRFGQRLAGSQAFSGLFREGMALVEETAAYLDGPGRNESKLLERGGSLAQASHEKAKVKLAAGDPRDEATLALLPRTLRELIARSMRLQDRIRRLDATIHSLDDDKPAANPIEHQLGLLKAAFERGRG